MLQRFTILHLILLSMLYAQDSKILISGTVLNQRTGAGLPGAEIFTSTTGTVTDINGSFSISPNPNDTVTVRCMGFTPQYMLAKDIVDIVSLSPKILEGQTIHVTSNKVIPGITPVAYSVMDESEIRLRYQVEDVPMILSSQPGVHAYSESGNGTGYSYVSIRGFDQSRISVLLDNVPLNDNESHQVYWVDHGDILSNAGDIEIQRGVGSSLYGAAAFGGSINVSTDIGSEVESYSLGLLRGSYNTEKYRFQYESGDRLGENLSLLVRASQLNSDGYRVDSRSEQESMMVGLSHQLVNLTNEFRATLGKELSVLQWDGISQEYLDDDELRREKMSWTVPFTDDYLQQIYSLNTKYLFNDHSALRNVLYLVKGTGFYEVDKFGQDLYSYNLDVDDIYPDSTEQAMEVDFTRRKWINNIYFGLTPVWTYEAKRWRSDLGLELRRYSGDHYGEVFNLSDSLIAASLPQTYEYYSYVGSKNIYSLFGHILFRFSKSFSGSLDLRGQYIDWKLDQKDIGHAQGHDVNAEWKFVNPRIGFRYQLLPELSIFASVGSAQKEPADSQIIEADDVWSQPVVAPTEQVVNYEAGLEWYYRTYGMSINFYQINYQNELLSDIYDFQDGSFDLATADLTVHEGAEIEIQAQVTGKLKLSANGSLSRNVYSGGELEGNMLPNVPSLLSNMTANYDFSKTINSALMFKHIGKQYIDSNNTETLAIPAYSLLDWMTRIEFSRLDLTLKINNLLDARYATYGYEYYGGYYWPGADRNYSLGINYRFN